MRILQINNAEEIGGGSERVYQLTSKMLLNRGHEVATLSCGTKSFDTRKRTILLSRNGYIQKNPLATFRNTRDFLYRQETAAAVRRLVKEFRPDLAHLHIFYGQLSSSVLAALSELRIPSVMTVHEYRMLCPISTMFSANGSVCELCASGNPLHAVFNRCNRGSILASGLSALEARYRDRNFPYERYIRHFFMVSRFCYDKHIEYRPKMANKSSVLYNFIPEADISAAPRSLTRTAPYLYSGRLSREKGLPLLCEAFALRPDLRLHIAGDGPLKAELQARFVEATNIVFLGKLDAAELKKQIEGARFAVIPSEWYENNPMSVLESFAHGLPVIGAKIGGIPELVIPDQTGELFAPSDISDLLRALDRSAACNDKKRAEMGRRALDHIRNNHDEDGYYAALMAEYKNVLLENKHFT